MEKTKERTILKITLVFLIVIFLATSTFLVTVLATKKSPTEFSVSKNEVVTTGMATQQTNLGKEQKETIEDEEGLDEDDLSQEELVNLKTDVTEEEAIQIALKRVDGKVTDVEIERKKGHEVYAVEINDSGDEVDVFVDIKTGEIVGTERDSEKDEDNDD